ncbi:MAG TPA: bifunctional protein-serine/threonine kinase/phosphatase [Xanthobacteraceae bacterium]|jgi:serine/threonine protein kinase|nr:bifunctional protein-serine/threonine kinase/phosphatase [Xanthobacteraceae bacterium]
MPRSLAISIGQYSDAGRKAANQDFHGALIPDEPLLTRKGIAVAIADGISSSDVSAVASETAIKSFLTDYYCTPETWSVKTSAQRVIAAANSWLHAQNGLSQYRYDKDRGYVCTFSAVVLKAATAHIFHIGDARIYHLKGTVLEQLTDDHRIVVSSEQSYLGRALGINPQIEIDYRALAVEKDDVFLLATDGVYEHVSSRFITETVKHNVIDLDVAAKAIADEAKQQGSPDNLTVQIVRIDSLPETDGSELIRQISELPCPPLLEARTVLDGYEIVREIHASSRSHMYLAADTANGELVALKIPSLDLRGDPAYLQRFMMEEWIARRINSPHVLKPHIQSRPRNYLYVVTEFIDGQTLSQWIIDNPKPDLEKVRGLVEQIAKGLQAFHRMEMLHQDLRPDNIIIDKTGTAKIIDFGSTRVSGIIDDLPDAPEQILGTLQYTAPEYFLGERASTSADIFSLGVITYQMLTGALPYGAHAAKVRTKSEQRKLRYRSARDDSRDIPAWVDGALKKAVDPDPSRRYDELSEFTFDLRHPNANLTELPSTPLMTRNPALLWQAISAILFVMVVILLLLLRGGR